MFEWYKRFQDGRDALEDDPKPGRPKNKNRDELVEKVREMIAYDANSTVRWIAEELNTTKDMIHEILTKDLNKRKVCARFVLHILNAPSHRTVAVREFFAKKEVCVLQHPPYSPHLSPCDYFLFPKLKQIGRAHV